MKLTPSVRSTGDSIYFLLEIKYNGVTYLDSVYLVLMSYLINPSYISLWKIGGSDFTLLTETLIKPTKVSVGEMYVGLIYILTVKTPPLKTQQKFRLCLRSSLRHSVTFSILLSNKEGNEG